MKAYLGTKQTISAEKRAEYNENRRIKYHTDPETKKKVLERNRTFIKSRPDVKASAQVRFRNKRRAQGLNTQTGKPLPARTGSIYLAQIGGVGPYKVSFTDRPNQRLSEIQKENHQPVSMVWIGERIKGVNFVEAAFHTKFKSQGKHVSGEWYTLTKTDIKKLKTAVNKIKTADHTVVV
jgi:Meiotically up-regulated gene 113